MGDADFLLRIPPTRSLPSLPAAALVRHRHEVHPGPHGRGECTVLTNLPCVPRACGGSGARGQRPRTSPCSLPTRGQGTPLAFHARAFPSLARPNDGSCRVPWHMMHACIYACLYTCACVHAGTGWLLPAARVPRGAGSCNALPPVCRVCSTSPTAHQRGGLGGAWGRARSCTTRP